MLQRSRIPANCIDRIKECPYSVDFGIGAINVAGKNHNKTLNGAFVSLRGQCIDELTKNFFWRDYLDKPKEERTPEEQALFTDNFKTAQVANDGTEVSWHNEGYKELAVESSQYMLSVLKDCDEVYTDKYFDLLDFFISFPYVQIYNNTNGVKVAYNPRSETEFTFGVSTDFSGVKDNTAYVIELKTGSSFGKDLETQVKIGCVAYAYYYPNLTHFVGMCYNPDGVTESEKLKVWKYTRKELKEFAKELKIILLSVFSSSQELYLQSEIDVNRIDWCNNCDCRRCPFSRKNKDNAEWQAKYKRYIDFLTDNNGGC